MLTDRNGFHLAQFRAKLLLDFVFDGQAVAVPTGDIGRTLTAQAMPAQKNVLECFVDHMPDVNIAVGKGRAIMQNPEWGIGAGVENLVIQIHLLPFGQTFWLVFDEFGGHGEICPGQIQRLFITNFLRITAHNKLTNADQFLIAANGRIIKTINLPQACDDGEMWC